MDRTRLWLRARQARRQTRRQTRRQALLTSPPAKRPTKRPAKLPASLPLPVRVAMVIVVGLGVGAITSVLQGRVQFPWLSLVDAASPWLTPMFVLGILWRRSSPAAVASLATGLCELVGYLRDGVSTGLHPRTRNRALLGAVRRGWGPGVRLGRVAVVERPWLDRRARRLQFCPQRSSPRRWWCTPFALATGRAPPCSSDWRRHGGSARSGATAASANAEMVARYRPPRHRGGTGPRVGLQPIVLKPIVLKPIILRPVRSVASVLTPGAPNRPGSILLRESCPRRPAQLRTARTRRDT